MSGLRGTSEADDADHRSWDEKSVGEWLRSINCAQYEQLFRGEGEQSG